MWLGWEDYPHHDRDDVSLPRTRAKTSLLSFEAQSNTTRSSAPSVFTFASNWKRSMRLDRRNVLRHNSLAKKATVKSAEAFLVNFQAHIQATFKIFRSTL